MVWEQALKQGRTQYITAILMPVVAFVLRTMLLPDLERNIPYVLFFPAVIFAALYGGLITGFLATISSALIISLLILGLNHSSILAPTDWPGMVVFLISAIMVSWLCESRHRFQTKLQQMQLREANYKLEKEAAGRIQSEEQFYKAFYTNPSIIAITSLHDGRYIDANENFAQAIGRPREEIIGHTSDEIYLWVDQREELKARARLVNEGKLRNFEMQYRTFSGETRIALLSGDIITLDDEPCSLSVMTDITAKKQVEQERMEALERFESVFTNSLVSKAVLRLPDRRMIDVNPAWEKLFGFSRSEALWHNADELGIIRPDTTDDWHRFRSQLVNEGSVQQEMTVWNKAGQSIRGLFSVTMIEKNGEKQALFTILDMTNQRRMEAEIAHLDRLNIIGEMAAGIGHEVRNPMTTVRGYLQLFQSREKFVDYHEDISIMIEELDRANSIISEFLSLAKDKKVDLKRGNINTVLNTLFPLLQADAFLRGHMIHLETSAISDIEMDDNELRQLVLNFVRNSLEAMQTGGVVSIKTCLEENTVVLVIRDTGHGIPKEVLEKLGVPFITTKENGTGLGLPVCYRIAQRHNAKIDVRTSSEGTTFFVKFKSIEVSNEPKELHL